MGHIFLNTSLTEAYCMAIVEAASCGLQVVSTSVGGIPEVLPDSLITLTEPTIDSVLSGLHTAIDRERMRRRRHDGGFKSNGGDHGKRTDDQSAAIKDVLCPFECNEVVRGLYNWQNVASRTENVYRRVLGEPDTDLRTKINNVGRACVPYTLVVSFMWLMLALMEWLVPSRHIDIARDFNDGPPPSKRRNKLNSSIS